jgi:predicted SnoaL-like aldol condensation-catalyzing enzyme
MTRSNVVLVLFLAAGLAACAQECPEPVAVEEPSQPEPVAATEEPSQEEINKQNAIAFYEAAINEKDFEKASQYMGDEYIQHNPLAADGPEGLKAFLAFAKENLGSFKVEIKQAFADGDYVILHVRARANPEDRGSAVMDIFRFEDGKVVEHWDVIQPIPEQAMNENTMF